MNPVSRFPTGKPHHREKTLDYVKNNKVSVFCRIRPLENDQESTCINLLSPTTLALTTPAEWKLARKEVHCQFKHIFTGYATQKEVFEHVGYPLLDDLFKGKNGLLFTNGVTGSGKTYTLAGDEHNPGILPKCIYTLFNTISQFQAPKYLIKSDRMNGFEVQSLKDAKKEQRTALRQAKKSKTAQKKTREKSYINDGCKIMDINESNLYSVFVSYIQIYNNTVFDLLDENTGKSIQGKILREDSQKNMYVNGVIETEVKSAQEVFELFNIGQKLKKNILNGVSSRSHSIFNIRVVQFQQLDHNEGGPPTNTDLNLLKVAQLSLVELAGSERTNRTQNTGWLLKETSRINNSLLSLRTCLKTLKDNQLMGSNRLIPYRDSRLTLLFKNYFKGTGRVEMIVCVNPSVEDFEENIQVMKFAEITQDVKVARAEPKFTPCKKKTQKKPATPAPTRTNGTFPMCPKLPEINLRFDGLKESQLILDQLINCLQSQQQIIRVNESNQENRVTYSRKDQHEDILGTSEMKAVLQKQKQEYSVVKSKLDDSEARNRELRLKIRDQQAEIALLRTTIAEKDLKIILEKEKSKQLALQNEKMTQEFKAKLRRQGEYFLAAMKTKNLKLLKACQILNSEFTPSVQK